VDVNELQWDAAGLLPVVIVDDRTNAVLTLAYANREALQRTIAERSTYLYSRSRGELWHKGATSGNTQRVVAISYDCDADALMYRVIPSGPACHTGAGTCFYKTLLASDTVDGDALRKAFAHLTRVLEERKTADPSSSYVAKLYSGGVDKIGKKIGEEATEVVIAAKNDSREELVWESADLLFHLLVLLAHKGVSLDDLGGELLRRVK
jgi:phosphoribosyl-ATP pyrophosphohydrolase/phosphoribosyl-AMP cyclohydrolase